MVWYQERRNVGARSPFLQEADKCSILIKITHNIFFPNLPKGWIQHDLVGGWVFCGFFLGGGN